MMTNIKKLTAVCLLCLLTAASLVLPAFAHGHRGGHHRATTQATQSVAVCPVENCTATGRHSHWGVTYCGYDHESGFCDGNCRALCTVSGCTLTGQHTHYGTAYCGYHHESGFCDGNCLALCTVKGCTLTGQHTHYGVSCCGRRHQAGFCDGSC